MTHDGSTGEWRGALAVAPEERQPRVALRGALERLTPVLEVMHRPTQLTATWTEREADGRERARHEGELLAVDGWRDVLERLDELVARAPTVVITRLVVTMATRDVERDAEVWRPGSAELSVSAPSPEASELAVAYTTSPAAGPDRPALADVRRALERIGS
jgi:hypothetical protein